MTVAEERKQEIARLAVEVRQKHADWIAAKAQVERLATEGRELRYRHDELVREAIRDAIADMGAEELPNWQ